MLSLPLTSHPSAYISVKPQVISAYPKFTATEQDTWEQAEDLWPATYIG